ncbi:CPBP family intramembrane glutamic endopeptidase [Streptococcus phocae]|uniref:CAAX protease n=1 Tax=Streptococcus phocae TaxID=119224 RepID=A0A0P6S0Y9_9STRE|nr:type II CAAX endopeptidase family protein [Streptococcus phocae]KPJ21708.1 CAAX protease [Streptococcus phocae]
MKKHLRNINWFNIVEIFVSSFLVLVVGDLLGLVTLPEISKEYSYWYTFMSYFSVISTWIAVLAVIYYFPSHRFIKSSIWKNKQGNTVSFLLWGLLVGFLLNLFSALLAFLHGDIHLTFEKFELLPLLGLLLAVFIQSSAEEVFCRGLIYQRLLKANVSPLVAIVLNSLFFAALHLLNDGISPLAFYDLLVTGIFFSLIVYYFDSLWMAMGIHASWNFTQSILLGLPNSGQSFPYSVFQLDPSKVHDSLAYNVAFGLEGTILSSLVMTICCLAIYIWKKDDKAPLWY